MRIPGSPQLRSGQVATGECPCGHRIHLDSEDVLRALLHGRKIEQGETLQEFQDEENIDIGSIARLVAGNRGEEEKCTDANGAELRLGSLQQA